jgi:hypothetical protein
MDGASMIRNHLMLAIQSRLVLQIQPALRERRRRLSTSHLAVDLDDRAAWNCTLNA